MRLSSNQLNETGHAKCVVCGKKVHISTVEMCVKCDRFACKSCTTKENGNSVCKNCK